MKEIDIIYDRFGAASLRIFDNGRVTLYDGRSIGFVHQTSLYDYNGAHRGWYESGLFRDHLGATVGFGEKVGNGPKPILPIKRIRPIPGIVSIEPIRPIRSIPPIKPIYNFGWSNLNPVTLFFS